MSNPASPRSGVTSDDGALLGERELRGWYLFFGIGSLAAAGVILAFPHRSVLGSTISALLCLGLFGLYTLIARPTQTGMRNNHPRSVAYLAIAVVVLGVAVGLNPQASVALFVISPQIFMMLSRRWAIVAVIVVNLGGFVGNVISGNYTKSPEAMWEGIAVTVGINLLSIFFGMRLIVIAEQNSARAVLIRELEEKQDEVARLSEEQGVSKERERIAREMHDTLAQGFTSILTLSRAMAAEFESDPELAKRHLALVTETAQQNLQESRRIIAALSPADLTESSLVQAIERVAARVSAETSMSVDLTVDGEARTVLPAIEVVALRVCQESLNNVRKHAQASRAHIELGYTDDAIEMDIRDDGRGFDAGARTDGFGLSGMRSRVLEVGGTLEVSSAVGDGTSVRVRLPRAPLIDAPSKTHPIEENS
jgi:signal transduction histidine kinase